MEQLENTEMSLSQWKSFQNFKIMSVTGHRMDYALISVRAKRSIVHRKLCNLAIGADSFVLDKGVC